MSTLIASPKSIFISRVLVAAWLLGASVWPQVIISVPSTAPDNCETKNCTDAAAKTDSQNTDTRLFSPRTWQMNDAERESANAREQKDWKAKTENGEQKYSRQYLPRREEETEFQKFIYQSTGVHLSIYGHDFLDKVSKQEGARDRNPVPADYTLMVGDQLLLHTWGQVEFNALTVVDRNGQIYLPKVGMITVVGVRYDQMRDYLKSAISRLFKNFDLSVSLGQMHSADIYVVGNVRFPGHYVMGPLSTVVNALYRAGGPSGSGSLRHVQLKRQGKVVTEIDLYDLLLYGGKSKDVLLLSGDVVYVPPVGPLVGVLGSVNRPAIYEMREAATVSQQIEQAAGLSATAKDTQVMLERIDDRLQRKVEKFALDEKGRAHVLRDGDLLRIFPVSPRFEDVVTLRGNVAHPGRYPWRAGMRVADLIPSPQAIITDDYWTQQNALGQAGQGWIEEGARESKGEGLIGNQQDANRSSGNNNPQDPDFNVTDEAKNREDEKQSEIAAAPKTQIKRNPAEINWDYAVVQRLNPADLSSQLISFNLGRAMHDASSSDNLSLEAGDIVTIFSQQDLQVPVEKRTKFVWVEGEVAAAGVYRVAPGENLRDLVARAGGLTPQAYLFASDFRRESTRIAQQEKLERMVDEMDRELRSRVTRVAASGNEEERKASKEELDSEKSVIEKLRQTTPTGRVVLDLKPSDIEISAIPTLSLEDGDRIIIPPKSATVEVVGAVYNQNSFLYRAGKNIADYLNQSGGGTRDSDAQRLFVIRADGSVVSKKMHRGVWAGRFESLKLMPGDTIVMPERIRTGSLIREIRDWSQIFSQFALGAAAIRVISP